MFFSLFSFKIGLLAWECFQGYDLIDFRWMASTGLALFCIEECIDMNVRPFDQVYGIYFLGELIRIIFISFYFLLESLVMISSVRIYDTRICEFAYRTRRSRNRHGTIWVRDTGQIKSGYGEEYSDTVLLCFAYKKMIFFKKRKGRML